MSVAVAGPSAVSKPAPETSLLMLEACNLYLIYTDLNIAKFTSPAKWESSTLCQAPGATGFSS
jgi:hypothetical protein